ncbi:MAG: hypothetical protein JO157_05790 [Acetobacteraceae bacterium]|nr:hypothetical protein [Acetobacteraceae bacterium]
MRRADGRAWWRFVRCVGGRGTLAGGAEPTGGVLFVPTLATSGAST